MDTQQKALYKRLEAFSLDDLDDELMFSQRLASDNGWTQDYAKQAVEEYKRFAFLALSAGHPVTPSDQVDQVWHLHLTYTRLYWETFCPVVLKQSLHHEPTRGGDREQQKFDAWYAKTLESYEFFFEQAPSDEFWPKPSERFGRDLQFVRTNTQQKWVIPKPPISRRVVGIAAAILIFGLCLYVVPIPGDDFTAIRNLSLSALLGYSGFGVTQTLARLLDALNSPSFFQLGGGGCAGAVGGCGGCSGGCGGG